MGGQDRRHPLQSTTEAVLMRTLWYRVSRLRSSTAQGSLLPWTIVHLLLLHFVHNATSTFLLIALCKHDVCYYLLFIVFLLWPSAQYVSCYLLLIVFSMFSYPQYVSPMLFMPHLNCPPRTIKICRIEFNWNLIENYFKSCVSTTLQSQ